MSTLASELKARGITLVDPLVAEALKAKKAGVTFDDRKEDFCFEREEEEENSTPKKKNTIKNSKDTYTKKESSAEKPTTQKPTTQKSIQTSNTHHVF
jgi:hypothetical protein